MFTNYAPSGALYSPVAIALQGAGPAAAMMDTSAATTVPVADPTTTPSDEAATTVDSVPAVPMEESEPSTSTAAPDVQENTNLEVAMESTDSVNDAGAMGSTDSVDMEAVSTDIAESGSMDVDDAAAVDMTDKQRLKAMIFGDSDDSDDDSFAVSYMCVEFGLNPVPRVSTRKQLQHLQSESRSDQSVVRPSVHCPFPACCLTSATLILTV